MLYFYSVEVIDKELGICRYAYQGACDWTEIRSLDDFNNLKKELTDMILNVASESTGIPKEELYVKFIAFNRI